MPNPPTPDPKDDSETTRRPSDVAENEEEGSTSGQDSASSAQDAPAKQASPAPTPHITHPGG